ncbi:MAG: menaquinol oxidoreductase [Geobacteraceae bacterium GWC2_55_20]|nr:MAG: menaquinol oxidoreductase [Geobacteraceae bacterium GWC2_55_20]OGU23126.1 MAG: menaquinol oxidoreductase [Geobacteraceae bacterium GWF2_54_21]HBA70827.1 menaquinol oxidoreductase [Geobacter sp.]HCE66015.1 menaquinol oxidoreductase [Geobacter sp.]
MTENTDNQPAPGATQSQRDSLLMEISADIKRLSYFSNRGLLAMSLFMVVSMLAWRGFPMLPHPDAARALLGAPPPPHMINLVLLLYTFSAIILSLSRMMAGVEHKSSFCHVGYLTAFFLFYHFAKALDDNYWAVFGSGITILSVESYRIWSYCKEAMTRKREQLEFVKRNGRMPVEE